MNTTVLACNFAGAELKKLKKLCSATGVRLRAVTPEDQAQPIGALCGVEKRLPGASPSAAPAEEKTLVFARLTERQLDSLLTEMRTARVGTDALKAVLTPSNAGWSVHKLAAELMRERASLG